MKKALLIRENEELSLAFLESIEKTYLPTVRSIADRVKAAGVEIKSKQFVCDLISGNFNELRSKYLAIANVDISSFQSNAGQGQMRATANQYLTDLCAEILKMIAGKTLENLPLNDQYFHQFFDMDPSGNPYIPDSAREQIFEMFKNYLNDPKLVRIHEAQKKACKALQEFADALNGVGMDKGLTAVPWIGIGGFFIIQREDSGRIQFTPREIDYETSFEETFEEELPEEETETVETEN